jgi:ABC-type dipeptide/oligopeptide/nickel transport system permease subunit
VFEEPSVTKIFIVLGIVNWAGIARLVRGSLLSIREREFAEAARALGVKPPRLVVRHLLPNALAPMLVAATIGVAGNILTEAWLSFLGLGAQAPLASWGSMITTGQPFMYTKPWICLCPGLAIMVTVLGFNLFGDGLRDILDPRIARGVK